MFRYAIAGCCDGPPSKAVDTDKLAVYSSIVLSSPPLCVLVSLRASGTDANPVSMAWLRQIQRTLTAFPLGRVSRKMMRKLTRTLTPAVLHKSLGEFFNTMSVTESLR